MAPVQKAPTQNAATTLAQTPPATGNRWLGPITGIAAGLGVAATLSHFGLCGAFASALGNMLVISLLAFAALFVWRMFRASRQAPATASPSRQAFDTPMGGLPGSSAKNQCVRPAAARIATLDIGDQRQVGKLERSRGL